jgi:NAD-dependent deacetylase
MEELIANAARDLWESKWAVAFTGAGMSTESEIPDIRGPHGVGEEYNRQALRLNYQRFLADPKGWWEERLKPDSIVEWLTGLRKKAEPNPGHFALAELEEMGIVKCVITQSFDRLHHRAGTKNVIEIYGNAFELRCTLCGLKVERDESLLQELPPRCKNCGGFMKTDIVSFGEPIPSPILEESYKQTLACDLMLICGTSLVIYPAAGLPEIAKNNSAKLIEINIEPLVEKRIFNYTIRGKAGETLPQIVEAIKKKRWEGM